MFTALVVLGVIVAAVLLFLVFGSGGFRATSDATAESRRLLQSGIPAKARVLDLRDTYTRVSANPLVEFRLEVRGAGASYEASTQAVVSVVDLPRFQPGAAVDVRVDPQDKTKVAIVVR